MAKNTHIRFDLSPSTSSSSIMSGEPKPMIHKRKKSNKIEKINRKKIKKILHEEEELHKLTEMIGGLNETIEEVRQMQNKLLIHFDAINYKIDWLEKIMLTLFPKHATKIDNF